MEHSPFVDDEVTYEKMVISILNCRINRRVFPKEQILQNRFNGYSNSLDCRFLPTNRLVHSLPSQQHTHIMYFVDSPEQLGNQFMDFAQKSCEKKRSKQRGLTLWIGLAVWILATCLEKLGCNVRHPTWVTNCCPMFSMFIHFPLLLSLECHQLPTCCI